MYKILMDIVTGRDGVTHDIVRWLAVLTALTAIFLTIYIVVYKDKDFDIQSFGIGMGTIFATVGVALKLKETTEPGHSAEVTTQIVDSSSGKTIETVEKVKQ